MSKTALAGAIISAIAPPPVDDPRRAEYVPEEAKDRRLTARGQNDTKREKDHVYGIESRDRWPDNNIHELHRDSMGLDNSNAKPGDEEEEEEEVDIESMTKAEIVEALAELEVEAPQNANKAALVDLYRDTLAAKAADAGGE